MIFLLKTPLPTLITLAVFIGYLIIKRKSVAPAALFFALAAIFYIALAMTSRADLGIRHILPVYPALFVAFGSLLVEFKKLDRRLLYALTGLVILLAVEFGFTYPYYLSYFNQLAGGTANGYKIASDSSLDWGQNLKRIKSYIDRHHIEQPYVDYYWDGLASYNYYHIDQRFLSDLISHPENRKGYAIVGAADLHSPDYQWLNNYPIVDKITPTVFVYKMN